MAPSDDGTWMSDFRQRTVMDRIPISGILELTSRCNLRCIHCYLGPQEEQRKLRHHEMTTEQVVAVIDQIVAAGCLYLVVTGGDPMVRKDFPEIYRHAREEGLIVTVFCDGVLVTEKIVRLFQDYPPFQVDVSIYGATAGTYERITRVAGSHARCLEGIRRLLEGGVKVSLKTVLTSINLHEVEAMRRLAADLGVEFRLDAAIFPCLPNHDHQPLDLRVSPQEAVTRELADPRRLRDWLIYTAERQHLPPAKKLYTCGAGLTNFYVDPFGYVSPCLMTTQYRYSLREHDFTALWSEQLAELREKTPRDGYGCNTCEMRAACTGCPAFNYQETGREDVKSDYVCETAKLRWEALRRARGAAESGGGREAAP